MLPEAKKRNLSCISQFVSKSKVNKSINIAVSESISFKKLNPSEKNVKINKNAIALIVGIGNYENTNADAIYADKDALIFSDYAKNKLGVSKNKIKLLQQ